MTRIGIFIPCYNVERSIPRVLNSFSPEVLSRVAEIVAVDNCSQDRTFNFLKDIQTSGAEAGRRLVILKNSQNYGLGGSQKIAYQYFLDHGFTHFLIVHGDNQGDGDAIAKSFFRVFDERPAVDLITASRFTKKSNVRQYNFLRTAANHLFNFLTFVLTGHWMTDSGAAIIFVRTEILHKIPFHHLTNSFQFNPELNILLYSLKDLDIVEVPLVWRDSEDRSNISPLKYCWTMLMILLRYRFNKSVRRKSGWQLFHGQSQFIKPSFQIFKS